MSGIGPSASLTALAAPQEDGPKPASPRLCWRRVIPTGLLTGAIATAASFIVAAAIATLYGLEPSWLFTTYLTIWAWLLPYAYAGPVAPEVVVLGSILYLSTGAVFGVGYHWLMVRHLGTSSTARQFFFSSLLGLGLWIVNYYLVLMPLQIAVWGKPWIVIYVPLSMAILAHLAFAWSMLLLEWLGKWMWMPSGKRESAVVAGRIDRIAASSSPVNRTPSRSISRRRSTAAVM